MSNGYPESFEVLGYVDFIDGDRGVVISYKGNIRSFKPAKLTPANLMLYFGISDAKEAGIKEIILEEAHRKGSYTRE